MECSIRKKLPDPLLSGRIASIRRHHAGALNESFNCIHCEKSCPRDIHDARTGGVVYHNLKTFLHFLQARPLVLESAWLRVWRVMGPCPNELQLTSLFIPMPKRLSKILPVDQKPSIRSSRSDKILSKLSFSAG